MNKLILLELMCCCVAFLQTIGSPILDNPFSFHRRIAKRTKEDYELCLKTKAKNEDRTVLLVPQGSQLQLSCKSLCLKPNQSSRKLWRFSQSRMLNVKPIDLSNDRMYISSDLSLQIKDATLDDTGTYYCVDNRKIKAMHTLDVVAEEPNRIIIDSKSGVQSAAKPLDTWFLRVNNLQLQTQWSEWSECSRCNRVGLRKKIGICTVTRIDNSIDTQPANIPHFLLKNQSSTVPCRSSLLPEKIANLKEIKERHSETLYGFCNTSCPDTGIEFVTESSGKIIETVDKSQNLYSFKQKLPELPHFVKRAIVFEEEGTKIVLSCPGDTIGKFIQWRNGSYALNPTRVHRITNGRVKIDYINQLHIRQLRLSDNGVYSCWHNNKMMATVKLIVEAKPQMTVITDLFHHLGTYFVVLLIVLLSISIFKNRNIAAKH